MTDQFDNFQLDPNVIGNDWVFSGDQVHANRAPGTKISNFNYYFAGARMSQDRTKTVFDFKNEENPERTIGAGFAGWGVDWSLFNYNPYGGRGDGLNPNFRVKNDWLQITGMGNIDVVTRDVMDKKNVDPSGMSAYRNYPTEGYNSFGKKGDKRWSWQGNSWVPGY
jgi:hypothetical protein